MSQRIPQSMQCRGRESARLAARARAWVAGNMARETSQFMGEAHVHGWRGTWRERRQFMGEAHVHGFCNRLERSIVVVDVREPAVVLSKYQPGSDVQRQLSMLEARDK